MARRLQDQLPLIAKQLQTQVIKPKTVQNEYLLKRKNQKQHFDKQSWASPQVCPQVRKSAIAD